MDNFTSNRSMPHHCPFGLDSYEPPYSVAHFMRKPRQEAEPTAGNPSRPAAFALRYDETRRDETRLVSAGAPNRRVVFDTLALRRRVVFDTLALRRRVVFDTHALRRRVVFDTHALRHSSTHPSIHSSIYPPIHPSTHPKQASGLRHTRAPQASGLRHTRAPSFVIRHSGFVIPVSAPRRGAETGPTSSAPGSAHPPCSPASASLPGWAGRSR